MICMLSRWQEKRTSAVGDPSQKGTDNEVAKVRALVTADHRKTLMMLEDELIMGKGLIMGIPPIDRDRRRILVLPVRPRNKTKECRMDITIFSKTERIPFS